MILLFEDKRPAPGRPLHASPAAAGSPLLPVFALLAAVSIGIALAFAYVGAWLVLPFAGIELAALAWAMHRCGGAAPRQAAVPPAPTFHCARRQASSRGTRRLLANKIRMTNLRRKPS